MIITLAGEARRFHLDVDGNRRLLTWERTILPDGRTLDELRVTDHPMPTVCVLLRRQQSPMIPPPTADTAGTVYLAMMANATLQEEKGE